MDLPTLLMILFAVLFFGAASILGHNENVQHPSKSNNEDPIRKKDDSDHGLAP